LFQRVDGAVKAAQEFATDNRDIEAKLQIRHIEQAQPPRARSQMTPGGNWLCCGDPMKPEQMMAGQLP